MLSVPKKNRELQIECLLVKDAFLHSAENLQLLETHISWVILAGEFAYKIKKPVKFDFVDYSTLTQRKKYCELEVELNRRFAPQLYVGVVPVYEAAGETKVGDEHWQSCGATVEPIDYAVKMKRFPQDAIVAVRLQNEALTVETIDEFGKYIARFHDCIESAIPTLACVQSDCIIKDALENFEALQQAFAGIIRLETLKELEHWTGQQLKRLEPKFNRRLRAGLVRRCHGDLHLKNVIQLDGQLHAFDGIEFNEEFQWIDVLSEIAFPVMDFVARGRSDLGWRLLNSYLEETGDYLDLDVLRFYLVYRALVRAKVTWLNPRNHLPEDSESSSENNLSFDRFAGPWDKYLEVARTFAIELKPNLAITHGFSGSGKSFVAMKRIEQQGGIRIRSDVERNRLASKFKTKDKYSKAMNDWVYSTVGEMSKRVLIAGFPVIADATFLKFPLRDQFRSLARELGVDFRIISCDAPLEELHQRLSKRDDDPSEATFEILKMQLKSHDPLTTDELQLL